MENFKKLGIKRKQEKFWENFAKFLKKFQSTSFIENTAFYRAEYSLLSSKTWQHWWMIRFIHDIERTAYCQTDSTSSQELFGGRFWTSCSLPRSGASVFYLLPNMHQFLGGKQFLTREEVMAVVHDYLSNLNISFYATEIAILFLHYKKCLNSFGNYVQK